MIKILVIADDFTGALDTGVKFSQKGIDTKVAFGCEYDFAGESVAVLVLCLPTRHLPYREAYEMVCRVALRAQIAGVEILFKKTDSALRGNVGAELSAVLDGYGKGSVCFMPAFPAMKRITVNGIHYIDGVPVAQSVFGSDPFEPVTESYIPCLLHKQCDTPIELVSRGCLCDISLEKNGLIYLFDVKTDDDLNEYVCTVRDKGMLHLVAGCAGVADVLANSLDFKRETKVNDLKRDGGLIVVCGSINPISCEQMITAEACGYRRLTIPYQELISDDVHDSAAERATVDWIIEAYAASGNLLISTQRVPDNLFAPERVEEMQEKLRQVISARVGAILKSVLDSGTDARIMIIGGDTLLAFLKAVSCTELRPIDELAPGTVRSVIRYHGKPVELITKSGGFGNKNLITSLLGQPCHAS
ncbi:MAG: four-carbon acid sugar kinase family protein [Oscillospiraceae bacterium]